MKWGVLHGNRQALCLNDRLHVSTNPRLTCLAFAFTLILSFVMSASFAFADASAAISSTRKDAMNAYESVLRGTLPYQLHSDNGIDAAVFDSEATEWKGDFFPSPIAYSRFCIADLDADGIPELILDVHDNSGYTYGYLLFRYQDGAVYGQCMVSRAMEVITLEGYIHESSGADDNGWYKLQNVHGTLSPVEVCRSETNGESISYFIGTEEVSEMAYRQYDAELSAKKQPMWFPFTLKNVAAIVAEF